MIYYDVPQGQDQWHELRRGVPTSSNFDRIMTPAKRKYSTQAHGYISELIGETLSLYGPERPESYTSNAMRHGAQTEQEARHDIAGQENLVLTNGGFCLSDDGRFGCSPDSLIGDDGCLELKCPLAKTQVEYVMSGILPAEYLCQVHGQLIVTGRKYVIFYSYHPGIKPLRVKVTPDDFTDELRVCLERFWVDYQAALTKVKGM